MFSGIGLGLENDGGDRRSAPVSVADTWGISPRLSNILERVVKKPKKVINDPKNVVPELD